MAITERSRKILWGRSGNRCAICKTELVLEKDPYNKHLNIGEECHIISRQPNGPRHKPIQDFDYDSSDNLLLLCCNHHTMIDEQVETYSEERLKQIKIEHESWVKENLEFTNGKPEIIAKSKTEELLDFITSKHDIEMNIKSSRQVFESQEGLQIAFSEVNKIKNKVKQLVDDLNSKAPNYYIQARDNRQHICDIRFKGHTLLVQFYQAYSNVADGSYLLFAVVDGLFDENGNADVFHPAKILQIIRLDFSYNDNGQFGWRNQENKKQFFTSDEITDIWTEKFFKTVLK
ncbi:MAG TPA: hypothetical protein P5050_11405 [Bacteroidia bacterium]|nr:hypothetical protein [Bacteroidia bacterium]